MLDPEKQLFPETPEDLDRMLIGDRAKIYCVNVGERRQVLLALKDANYSINSASLQYLPEDYTGFEYPHPGFTDDCIACFRSAIGNWILPEDVLFALGVCERPYVPDADWFSSSLDELFETAR